MKKIKVYALVISDVHLGSPDCQALLLLEVLQRYDFELLIIVGDLYQWGQINDEQMEIVDFIRKIGHKNIVYIDGNHDPIEEAMEKNIFLIGKIVEEFFFTAIGSDLKDSGALSLKSGWIGRLHW